MSILASRPKNCPSFPDFSTPHLRLRGKRTKAHTPTPAQPPDGAFHTLNLPSPICLLITLHRVIHALSSPSRSRIAHQLGLARAPDDVSLAGSAPPLCHPRRAGVTSPCFLSKFASVPRAKMARKVGSRRRGPLSRSPGAGVVVRMRENADLALIRPVEASALVGRACPRLGS